MEQRKMKRQSYLMVADRRDGRPNGTDYRAWGHETDSKARSRGRSDHC